MSVKQMSIAWDLNLEHSKKFVLLAYADHADDDGENVYPSLGRVAHKTGYSRDQVRRISRQLVEAKLMALVEPANAANRRPARYRLTLKNGVELPPFKPRDTSSSTPPAPPSPLGANDPPHLGAPMPPEPSLEPSVSTPTGEGKPSTSEVGELCQYLREDLAGEDVPLLKGREGRYGKEFKAHLSKGTGQALLYKAADRIIERWRADDHRKLTVEQALEDVTNGKAPAHVEGGRKYGGPPPWEPINPHGKREMRVPPDELERRRKKQVELSRMMAEAIEKDKANA